MKRAAIVALGLSVLLAPVPAMADPISINVLSATYSANLSARLHPSYGDLTVTTAASGSSPLTESLEVHVPFTVIDPNDGSVLYSGEHVINSTATADWLSVSDQSIHGFNEWIAKTVADFDVTFSPVADVTTTLGLYTTKSGEYGSGFGRLFDVTTQQEVWQFSFGSDFGGCDLCPVAVIEGGIESFPFMSGPFVLPTTLNAADVYDLHLIASAWDPTAVTNSSVQLSGLVPVPEPSSVLLLGIGLGTTLVSPRRLRKRRDP